MSDQYNFNGPATAQSNTPPDSNSYKFNGPASVSVNNNQTQTANVLKSMMASVANGDDPNAYRSLGAQYLSQMTGVPYSEVLNNYDQYAKNFSGNLVGDSSTNGKNWLDTIAQSYDYGMKSANLVDNVILPIRNSKAPTPGQIQTVIDSYNKLNQQAYQINSQGATGQFIKRFTNGYYWENPFGKVGQFFGDLAGSIPEAIGGIGADVASAFTTNSGQTGVSQAATAGAGMGAIYGGGATPLSIITVPSGFAAGIISHTFVSHPALVDSTMLYAQSLSAGASHESASAVADAYQVGSAALNGVSFAYAPGAKAIVDQSFDNAAKRSIFTNVAKQIFSKDLVQGAVAQGGVSSANSVIRSVAYNAAGELTQKLSAAGYDYDSIDKIATDAVGAFLQGTTGGVALGLATGAGSTLLAKITGEKPTPGAIETNKQVWSTLPEGKIPENAIDQTFKVITDEGNADTPHITMSTDIPIKAPGGFLPINRDNFISKLDSIAPSQVMKNAEMNLNGDSRIVAGEAISKWEEETGYSYSDVKEVASYIHDKSIDPSVKRSSSVDDSLNNLGMNDILPNQSTHEFVLNPDKIVQVKDKEEAIKAGKDGVSGAYYEINGKPFVDVFKDDAVTKVNEIKSPDTDIRPQDVNSILEKQKLGERITPEEYKTILKNVNGIDENTSTIISKAEENIAHTLGYSFNDFINRHAISFQNEINGDNGEKLSGKFISDRMNNVVNVIFSKEANATTVIHELTHFAVDEMNVMNHPLLKELEDYTGKKYNDWNESDLEKVASNMESLIQRGEIKQPVFKKLTDIFRSIYKAIPERMKGMIPKQVRDFFDKLVSGESDNFIPIIDSIDKFNRIELGQETFDQSTVKSAVKRGIRVPLNILDKFKDDPEIKNEIDRRTQESDINDMAGIYDSVERLKQDYPMLSSEDAERAFNSSTHKIGIKADNEFKRSLNDVSDKMNKKEQKMVDEMSPEMKSEYLKNRKSSGENFTKEVINTIKESGLSDALPDSILESDVKYAARVMSKDPRRYRQLFWNADIILKRKNGQFSEFGEPLDLERELNDVSEREYDKDIHNISTENAASLPGPIRETFLKGELSLNNKMMSPREYGKASDSQRKILSAIKSKMHAQIDYLSKQNESSLSGRGYEALSYFRDLDNGGKITPESFAKIEKIAIDSGVDIKLMRSIVGRDSRDLTQNELDYLVQSRKDIVNTAKNEYRAEYKSNITNPSNSELKTWVSKFFDAPGLDSVIDNLIMDSKLTGVEIPKDKETLGLMAAKKKLQEMVKSETNSDGTKTTSSDINRMSKSINSIDRILSSDRSGSEYVKKSRQQLLKTMINERLDPIRISEMLGVNNLIFDRARGSDGGYEGKIGEDNRKLYSGFFDKMKELKLNISDLGRMSKEEIEGKKRSITEIAEIYAKTKSSERITRLEANGISADKAYRISKSLPSNVKSLVDWCLDKYKELAPDYAKTYQLVTGTEFKWTKGDYSPIIVDQALLKRDDLNQFGHVGMEGTGRGKEMNEFSKSPINLDFFHNFFYATANEINYTHKAIPVKVMSNVIRSNTFKSLVMDKFGEPVFKLMDDILKTQENPAAMAFDSHKTADGKFLEKFASNYATGHLGLNISTALGQTGGIFAAIPNSANPPLMMLRILSGLPKDIFNLKKIENKSSYLRNSIEPNIKAMEAATIGKGTLARIFPIAKKMVMTPIGALVRVTNAAVWDAYYHEGISLFKNEDEAIGYSNKQCSRILPGVLDLDKTAVVRNAKGFGKLFVMFNNGMSKIFAQTYKDSADYMKTVTSLSGKTKMSMRAKAFNAFVLASSATVAQSLVFFFAKHGRAPNNEDEVLSILKDAYLSNIAVWGPIFSSIADMVNTVSNPGAKPTGSVKGMDTPLEQLANTGARAASAWNSYNKKQNDGNWKKLQQSSFDSSSELAAAFTGLPIPLASKSFKIYNSDSQDNKNWRLFVGGSSK